MGEALEEFGEIEYALIVRDRETGRPRGSAFVKFKTKEAADACLSRASNEALVSGADARRETHWRIA